LRAVLQKTFLVLLRVFFTNAMPLGKKIIFLIFVAGTTLGDVEHTKSEG